MVVALLKAQKLIKKTCNYQICVFHIPLQTQASSLTGAVRSARAHVNDPWLLAPGWTVVFGHCGTSKALSVHTHFMGVDPLWPHDQQH